MANVVKRKTGYLVQFYLNRERKTISFSSKYTLSEVQEIAQKVELLVIAFETDNPISKKTNEWLHNSTPEILNKLRNSGLIEVEPDLLASQLFESYLSSPACAQLKDTTQGHKKNTISRFFSFFSVDTPALISEKQAHAFSEYLSERYAEATRATTIRDLRRIYNWGVSKEMVESNPFSNIKRGSFKNKNKEFYVDMQTYQRLLDACETQEQRVLIALYRIGGLRRSEALLLRWSDVDLDNGRLLVTSPKTEKTGKGSRIIPLYPQLKKELAQLPRSEYVIEKSRASLDYTIAQIMKRAGLHWQRPIQNLRSSRAIEIYRDYGPVAEREWIGHTEKTAFDHYLHLLDSDFQKALNFVS